MKQKEWRPGGWRIMFTWGQGFGVGFWLAHSFRAIRVNGIDLLLGPVTLTIQPPIPAWLADGLAESRAAKKS